MVTWSYKTFFNLLVKSITIFHLSHGVCVMFRKTYKLTTYLSKKKKNTKIDFARVAGSEGFGAEIQGDFLAATFPMASLQGSLWSGDPGQLLTSPAFTLDASQSTPTSVPGSAHCSHRWRLRWKAQWREQWPLNSQSVLTWSLRAYQGLRTFSPPFDSPVLLPSLLPAF